jgi:pimeloyl-ACP methyl ester carboxylesterase
MMKIIPFLTNNSEFTFDLIIPSMIGYGFSERINKHGCNVRFMADLWFKLMKELEYEKFGAQGGDFGAGVSTVLGLNYPDNLIGLHLNYIPGSYKPYLAERESLTPEEIQFEKDEEEWFQKEGAYAAQHGTKPLTLAYGLNDSPVGLCAWIIEKFHGWADCKENIENIFTKDELLANVTLYWVTETIHSSIRLYNENRKVPLHFTKNDFVKVPVGIARFPLEEPFPPRKYIERGYNIQQWTEMPEGGHFAAMEQPELLAKDIITFFKKI